MQPPGIWSGADRMTRDELLRSLEELLDEPVCTLGGSERLDSLEGWDSGAMIGFMGLADEHFGVTLSPRQFLNCGTVNDLIGLLPLS